MDGAWSTLPGLSVLRLALALFLISIFQIFGIEVLVIIETLIFISVLFLTMLINPFRRSRVCSVGAKREFEIHFCFSFICFFLFKQNYNLILILQDIGNF